MGWGCGCAEGAGVMRILERTAQRRSVRDLLAEDAGVVVIDPLRGVPLLPGDDEQQNFDDSGMGCRTLLQRPRSCGGCSGAIRQERERQFEADSDGRYSDDFEGDGRETDSGGVRAGRPGAPPPAGRA